MSFFPHRTLGALTALLVIGAPTWAQNPPATPSKDELELLELLNTPVTGASKREQRLIDSPQAIEVITWEDIRQMGIYRLQDALKLMTSIDVIEAENGYSVIGMRGVMQEGQPRTVQVLIDGVPLYTPLGGTLDLNNLPLPVDLIERIEVVRGPSSTLYGANAVVGVIAISTKKLDQGLHADLRASKADKATFRSAANLRWSDSGFGVLAGYSGASFGDSGYRTHQVGHTLPYPNPLGGTIDPWITFDGPKGTGHQSDKAHQSAAYARIEYRAENSSYWFSAGQSRKMLSPVGQPPVSYMNYRFYEIGTLLAGWNQTWSKAFSTEVRIHRMQNKAGAGPSGILATVLADPAWTGENTWGDVTSDQIDLQANWNPSGTIHFVFGADTRKILFGKDITHGLTKEEKESASGGFASVDWNIVPSQTLSAGFRLENESLGGSRVSPRIMHVWNPSTNSVLRAAILTSTRSPQYFEQRINFTMRAPVTGLPPIFRILPNPDLKPEKTVNYEIGYRHVFGSVTLDATLYQMNFTDLITQETSGLFLYPSPPFPPNFYRVDTQFRNTGNATNRGVELAASWLIKKGWTTGVNLGYVDFKKDNPKANDPLGNKFAYTSGMKANAWTRLSLGGWFGSLGLQYTGATDVEALQVYGSPLYDKRDSQFQFQANVGYEFIKGLSASLYARNAAKEFTEQGTSGPDRPTYYMAARREYGGTIAYRF